ncbi:MAG: hypothetical protein ABJE66_05925 [Deltaproteobacteria bacterium]
MGAELGTDPAMLRLGGFVAGLTALIWLVVLGWRWLGDQRASRRASARRKSRARR